jgi:hypothetical protein
MVFGAEVFRASTSVLVVGCSVGSVVVAWRFVDGSGCSVCGMCMVSMVVWVVVRSFYSPTWDEHG